MEDVNIIYIKLMIPKKEMSYGEAQQMVWSSLPKELLKYTDNGYKPKPKSLGLRDQLHVLFFGRSK